MNIKIALVGCGGRGTGAAAQALATKGPTQLWAVADVFEDRLKGSMTQLGQRFANQLYEPIRDVPEVIDFPRDVQPVLNALCTDCHGYEKTARGGPRAGRLLLAGDRGPIFSHSYYMLTIARLFADGRNQPKSNYDPRALGSSASKLLTMLDSSHHGVQATPHQKTMLRLWIESAAAYPGTYAALGSGMIGNYAENNQVNTGAEWPVTQAAAEVIKTRAIEQDYWKSLWHQPPTNAFPLNARGN